MTALTRTPGSREAPKRLLGPRAPFATQRRSPKSRVKRETMREVSPSRYERTINASVWTIAMLRHRARVHDAARDHHLERLLHAERGGNQGFGRIEQEKSRRGIGSVRKEYAHERCAARKRHAARGGRGHERERVAPRRGELDQDHALECPALVPQEHLSDLLHHRVEAAEERHAEEHPFEDGPDLAPQEIVREEADGQDDREHREESQARNSAWTDVAPAQGRAQKMIHKDEEPPDDVDRDRGGSEHEEAREERVSKAIPDGRLEGGCAHGREVGVKVQTPGTPIIASASVRARGATPRPSSARAPRERRDRARAGGGVRGPRGARSHAREAGAHPWPGLLPSPRRCRSRPGRDRGLGPRGRRARRGERKARRWGDRSRESRGSGREGARLR